ncbi:AI-2E family transporter [Ancylobacter sonchi]|uniref:AI-2E family transporter n=1 Tax=Ancylobacter sonchi TaxID=1937790 RepID=UPI001BD30B58|nr:AI-2E family transporter [Ancylobacter sonchi]MBS7532191.1 AI-2E family transporter [Ancylobacter sonchi]
MSDLLQSPKPLRAELVWLRLSQIAAITLAVLALAGVLVVARAVLIPIVAAVIIGSVIGPFIEALARRGIPSPVTAVLIVIVMVAAFYGAATLLAGPLAEWIERMPEISETLRERFAALRPAVQRMLFFVESLESIGRTAERPMTVSISDSRMLESAIGLVTPALGAFILFVGSLLFFLAGRIQIKRKVVRAIGPRAGRLTALRVFREIETRLGTYLVTATFINAGLGVATTLLAWALGLPTPVLWGVLAGVLNYIPYVGPAMMTLVLALVGLVSFPGLFEGLLPAALFVVLTSIEGHLLTPMIVGRRVSLNPFAVFLSMALWTWLWGPIGTFLSVPLLIAAMALVDALLATQRPQLPG